MHAWAGACIRNASCWSWGRGVDGNRRIVRWMGGEITRRRADIQREWVLPSTRAREPSAAWENREKTHVQKDECKVRFKSWCKSCGCWMTAWWCNRVEKVIEVGGWMHKTSNNGTNLASLTMPCHTDCPFSALVFIALTLTCPPMVWPLSGSKSLHHD